MPSSTALRKCPELIFVAPRFDVYRTISRQIRTIFSDYTPLIEPLSLDEAYLDVTANLRGIPTASATAADGASTHFPGNRRPHRVGRNLLQQIPGQTGLRPSQTDNGQFVITPAMGAAFVEALPIGKFHGVGPVTAAKMHQLGIFTGADLRCQSLPFLQQHFGKSAAWYFAIARGQDDRPVVPDRPRKSSGSETTFARDLIDRTGDRNQRPGHGR